MITVRPRVLECSRVMPIDSAGNLSQRISLLFACGHTESYYSLDLGKSWKPRTKRQIERDELFITCPSAVKLCRECSKAGS